MGFFSRLIRKNNLYSTFITLFLLFLSLVFLTVRGVLNPTYYTNSDPYYDLYFKAFFPFNVALDMHEVILFFIVVIIPFYVPIFVVARITKDLTLKKLAYFVGFANLSYLLFSNVFAEKILKIFGNYIELGTAVVALLFVLQISLIFVFLLDSVRVRNKEFWIFLTNMGVSLILIFVFVFTLLPPLNIYLNNTMYRKNAEIFKLVNVAYNLTNDNSLTISTHINSSEEKSLALPGGITYCFRKPHKNLFCLTDYDSSKVIGIYSGDNYHTSSFSLLQDQITKLRSTDNLTIVIELIGQDGAVVQYTSPI